MLRHKLLSTGSEITELRGQRLLIAEERLLRTWTKATECMQGINIIECRREMIEHRNRDYLEHEQRLLHYQ